MESNINIILVGRAAALGLEMSIFHPANSALKFEPQVGDEVCIGTYKLVVLRRSWRFEKSVDLTVALDLPE